MKRNHFGLAFKALQSLAICSLHLSGIPHQPHELTPSHCFVWKVPSYSVTLLVFPLHCPCAFSPSFTVLPYLQIHSSSSVNINSVLPFGGKSDHNKSPLTPEEGLSLSHTHLKFNRT